MSTLWVVRHGQASFFSSNYDQLSELGHRQSRELGRYFADRQTRFDRVIVGPRVRHRETWQGLAEIYAERELALPAVERIDELDEYPFQQLIPHGLKQLAERGGDVQKLATAFRDGDDRTMRTFNKLFEQITRSWIAGEIPLPPEIETFQQFRERVAGAVGQMTNATAGKQQVIAFTSAGALAGIVGQALELSDQKTIELSWIVKNGAFAEFRFSGPRFSFFEFNATPHLSDPALISYR